MIQQKRFGRAVGLPSTVQIVRELKALVRRDAEAAAGPGLPELDGPVAPPDAPSAEPR